MLSVQYELSGAQLEGLLDDSRDLLSGMSLVRSGHGRGARAGLQAPAPTDKLPIRFTAEDNPDDPSIPPIFAKFATAPPAAKPPTLVAVIPRQVRPTPLDLSSETDSPSPKHKSRRLSFMHRAPSPTIVTTSSPAADSDLADAPDQPSDGPLFRAFIGSLERRAQTLRSSLKVLTKSLEASLSALQANHAAQSGVDDALEGLSISSSGTLKSEVLGGLYAGVLGPQRGVANQARQIEINNLDELLNRLRNSSERLKVQEQRRKDFESASKKYYDEISKASRHLASSFHRTSPLTPTHSTCSTSREPTSSNQRLPRSTRSKQSGPTSSTRPGSTTAAGWKAWSRRRREQWRVGCGAGQGFQMRSRTSS